MREYKNEILYYKSIYFIQNKQYVDKLVPAADIHQISPNFLICKDLVKSKEETINGITGIIIYILVVTKLTAVEVTLH